jgi:aldehyde dehydrogenase (NAD+)
VENPEGGVLSGEGYESGCYVKPAIAEAENSFEIVQHETLLQYCIY